MEQVVLQSQNGGSSSAETSTQKEQVVVQSLDGESVSAMAGKEVPMSVAVAEGHDDAMLNDLIDANDEGVNQLSRNELEPSQVVRPVLAVVTRRQAASDRMNTNVGTTDDDRNMQERLRRSVELAKEKQQKSVRERRNGMTNPVARGRF